MKTSQLLSEEQMRISKRGLEIFGSKVVFDLWLNSNIKALGKIKPKSLMNNFAGIKKIDLELTRIEHGVLA